MFARSVSNSSFFESSCNIQKKQKIRQLSIKVLQLYGGKNATNRSYFYLWKFSRFVLFKTDTARFSLPFRFAIGPCFLFPSRKMLANSLVVTAFGLCSYWHAEQIAFFSNVREWCFPSNSWMTIDDIQKEKRKEKKVNVLTLYLFSFLSCVCHGMPSPTDNLLFSNIDNGLYQS